MKKRKNSAVRTLLTLLLAVVMVFYVGYQTYRSIFSGVETEMAVTHSVFESIGAEGIVFRAEKVIDPVSNGYPYYTVENGTRVARNSVIASVYAAADSGRIEQEINAIDEQIKAFKTIQADAGSGRLTLNVIDKQLSDSIYDLIYKSDNGSFESISESHFSILSLMSKKQLVTGKAVDLSEKIKALENERAALKQNYKAPTSVIKAPVSGYFADRTDGYESLLTTDKLSDLTVKQVSDYIEMSAPVAPPSSGKIVSGYEWYIACVVPDSYYNTLGVGNALSLQMSFVLDEPIPVTVYACNKDNQGKLAVVFRCEYMSEELSTIRKEPMQIQLIKHTGLRVPKRAVVINEEQQAGVYVRSGNVVAFRKIEQQYSEAADYIICKPLEESGYLKLYDDIIVGGRDLYDGKIIH